MNIIEKYNLFFKFVIRNLSVRVILEIFISDFMYFF